MKKLNINRHSIYQVKVSTDLADYEWDRFVENEANGQYEQTSRWAQVKSVYGWDPVRVVFFSEGRIVTGIQILRKKFFKYFSVGYATKGPVFAIDSSDIVQRVIETINRVLPQYRIVYLLIQPPDDGLDIPEWLVRYGYKIDDTIDVVSATTTIDLSKTLDDIFKSLTKNNRRFIRHGERKGIRVREGTWEDIPLFYDMMKETCRRQGVAPNPPDVSFVIKLWRIFHPTGNVRLFLAEHKGVVISGVLAIPFGRVFRAWKLGWSGSLGHFKPNQVLFWEMIKWAKKNGYALFDFVGIDRNAAESILDGTHFSKVARGSSFFKLMFKGDIKLLPKAYFYIYNPLLRQLYSEFYSKVIRLKQSRSFLSRFVNHCVFKENE